MFLCFRVEISKGPSIHFWGPEKGFFPEVLPLDIQPETFMLMLFFSAELWPTPSIHYTEEIGLPSVIS